MIRLLVRLAIPADVRHVLAKYHAMHVIESYGWVCAWAGCVSTCLAFFALDRLRSPRD